MNVKAHKPIQSSSVIDQVPCIVQYPLRTFREVLEKMYPDLHVNSQVSRFFIFFVSLVQSGLFTVAKDLRFKCGHVITEKNKYHKHSFKGQMVNPKLLK